MQTAKSNYKKLINKLFDDMDKDQQGVLNLENMKKLYTSIPEEHRDSIRDKFRKFIIDNQKFLISKEEFVNLFHRSKTPYVHINLSHLKEYQRIKMLSQAELKNLMDKRKETKENSNFKPRFIIKNNSPTKSLNDSPIKMLKRVDSADPKLKNNNLLHVRRAYFSSLS